MRFQRALPIALAPLVGSAPACAPPARGSREPTSALVPAPAADDVDWPMFRDDPERTGYAEGTHLGTRASIAWSVRDFNQTAYGAVKGSPSVADGVLYCGTDTGRFVAVRADDGSGLWELHLPKTTHGIHGSPAMTRSTVFVTAYDGGVYAIERATGRVVWSFFRGYQVGSSPALVPSWGMLFTAHETLAGTGYIVALDATRGVPVWEQPTVGHPHTSVAVDVERRRAFGADNHGFVYAFDAATGERVWTRELRTDDDKPARVKTTPTVITDRGLVVFGAWSGKVYALRESDGSTAWESEIGGKLMGSTAYSAVLGLVYVGSPRGMFYALDVVDGAVRWSRPALARVVSSPAVSGDERTVVFGAGDRVLALDAASGDPFFSVTLDGEVSGSPTLVGQRIYVTAKGGGLWAIDTWD